MTKQGKLWPTLLLVALLVACASATPTPTPPRPTATPAPTPVLATSGEQIVGTWVGTGAAADRLYQRFNPDGTVQAATTLEKLNSTPGAELTFRFEGTQFLLTEVSATGLPSCSAKTGTYQVQLLPDGNIKFVKVQDACAPRARSMAMVHKRVP
jgi:hypothetical protein